MNMRSIFPVLLSMIYLSANAQQSHWQHKDLQKDSVFGMSTEKAFNELLKGKTAKTIVVAIIDSGIDTAHADLHPVLWTDAKTGIHGWNYIGAETGREDVTLLVADKKEFYDSLAYTMVPDVYRAGYQQHRKVEPALSEKRRAMEKLIESLSQVNTADAREISALAQYHLDHGLNTKNTEKDTANGDADITPDKVAPIERPNRTCIHGSHVAGIIGSPQFGVAKNVQLMMLKTNGNIRELRDKSLAKAIRFAVDHGARVINCSFGKPYSWDKKSVDEAVQYAMSKNAIIIHAAGNSHEDLDHAPNFPNPNYLNNKGKAAAWLEVGASDDKGNSADFSNYGKSEVDVFAPGVNIYSSVPYNKYEIQSGTSMAAPMVSGLAALIMGYFPKLSAAQVKDIIMKTVVKRENLTSMCVSGGIVNSFDALKLAATY